MENLAGIDLGLTATDSCSCCSHGASADEAMRNVSAAVVQEYDVTGMTCSHCISSVTEELSTLSGVQSVSVALNAGGPSRVTVASDAKLEDAAVRAAIDEAGYTLVD